MGLGSARDWTWDLSLDQKSNALLTELWGRKDFGQKNLSTWTSCTFLLEVYKEFFFSLNSFGIRSSVSNALELESKGPRFNPWRNQPQKNFTVGGFQFMLFLNPLASTIKLWTLFFLGPDFLFKSILTWCDRQDATY